MTSPLLETLSSAPTSSSNNDLNQSSPSIFELFAEDELRGMIQPAFRYVLAWAANHNPRYFLRLVDRHEEVYAIALGLIESWHLQQYDASFSEHFYNLQVVSTSVTRKGKEKAITATLSGSLPLPNTSRKLSRRQKWGYLACIVGIPYLRLKLFDLYRTSLSQSISSNPSSSHSSPTTLRTLFTRLRHLLLHLFKTVYPWCNLSWELYLILFDLKWLFDSTNSSNNQQRKIWRPWWKWLNISVIRRQPLSSSPSPSNHPLSFHHKLFHLGSSIASHSLPLTLLTLKALQWWYSPVSPRLTGKAGEGEGMLRVKSGKMVLPARKGWSGLNLEREREEKAEEGLDGNDDDDDDDEGDDGVEKEEEESTDIAESSLPPPKSESNPSTEPPKYRTLPYATCPICLVNPWNNPTITSSGYVGCYVCLYKEVVKRGTCPVTGLEMRVEDLRKVLV